MRDSRLNLIAPEEARRNIVRVPGGPVYRNRKRALVTRDSSMVGLGANSRAASQRQFHSRHCEIGFSKSRLRARIDSEIDYQKVMGFCLRFLNTETPGIPTSCFQASTAQFNAIASRTNSKQDESRTRRFLVKARPQQVGHFLFFSFTGGEPWLGDGTHNHRTLS